MKSITYFILIIGTLITVLAIGLSLLFNLDAEGATTGAIVIIVGLIYLIYKNYKSEEQMKKNILLNFYENVQVTTSRQLHTGSWGTCWSSSFTLTQPTFISPYWMRISLVLRPNQFPVRLQNLKTTENYMRADFQSQLPVNAVLTLHPAAPTPQSEYIFQIEVQL